jgi:hypothetical protein
MDRYPPILFEVAEPAKLVHENLFMKKLTRDLVVPIISAPVVPIM